MKSASMDHDVFLLGAVLFAASLVFVLLFRRYGLGAVLGYIVAGLALAGGLLMFTSFTAAAALALGLPLALSSTAHVLPMLLLSGRGWSGSTPDQPDCGQLSEHPDLCAGL